MDPLACWKLAQEAAADGEFHRCFYALRNLELWLEKGGFRPVGVTDAAIRELRSRAKLRMAAAEGDWAGSQIS